MNERTKKVVAGIVLSTFTVGCATPVFASDEMPETLPVQPVVVEQIESGSMPAETEPYSVPGTILKAVKKIVKDYWDELPLPDKADAIRDKLLDALDFYFQYSDDVETAIRNAIYDVFPNANESVVNAAVFFITALLPV